MQAGENTVEISVKKELAIIEQKAEETERKVSDLLKKAVG